MSILNFFKKSPSNPSIKVRVWINQAAKERACIKMAQADPTLIFIAWSGATYDHFQTVFRKQNLDNEVLLARDVLSSRMTGRNFVFLERHYDLDKENEFLESIDVQEVLAHISLMDPLMSAFNGDQLQKVMKDMGHRDDECIEHKMIDKSIERAMRKIKSGELPQEGSESLKEWMRGIA